MAKTVTVDVRMHPDFEAIRAAIREELVREMLADLTAERIRYEDSPWWSRTDEGWTGGWESKIADRERAYVWTEETIAEALEGYLPDAEGGAQ